MKRYLVNAHFRPNVREQQEQHLRSIDPRCSRSKVHLYLCAEKMPFFKGGDLNARVYHGEKNEMSRRISNLVLCFK